jgi:hypothetical protein
VRERCTQAFWGRNAREREHLEVPGTDGKMILKWLFREWDGGQGLDCSGSGLGQVAGYCKNGNEHSGSIKYREFVNYLRTG